MYFTPISAHLFAILTACVEVSYLICSKYIMHIFGQFCLQRCHHCKFFTNKNLGEQLMSSGKYHCLLFEVLNVSTLSQELRHIVHLMTSFLRKTVTCTRKNGSTNEYGHIRELCDKLLHQSQILCTIVLSGHVDLQKCNINIAQVIIITLGRVADEKITLWVVVFQPIFEGSTYEATSNNSNVNHIIIFLCSF